MNTDGHVRWSVDPNEEVALRFDDDDFLAALKASAGDLADSLERLLGGPPADATFGSLIEDDVVIMARAGISSRQDDELGNRSQQRDARKGVKIDVHEANVAQWGAWVTGIQDNAGSVPAALNSRKRRDREEAFGALPSGLADVLTARLMIHVREAKAGALRDPNKVAPRAGGKGPGPTSGNANGGLAIAGKSD